MFKMTTTDLAEILQNGSRKKINSIFNGYILARSLPFFEKYVTSDSAMKSQESEKWNSFLS